MWHHVHGPKHEAGRHISYLLFLRPIAALPNHLSTPGYAVEESGD